MSLIGIGEFSHGINESWKYRFNCLQKVIKSTDKNVIIFNEMSIWQAKNVMTDPKIRIEKKIPCTKKEDNPAWGKLWRYISHTMESKIFLKIIIYIRKHKDRITLIGVDNDTLSRDFDMSKIILKHIDIGCINFFWAHNSHVDSRLLDWNDYKWTKRDFPNLKHSCGYYLKKKLKDKYCIILSQAHKGENRFNSYCSGDGCTTRIWKSRYFYHKFVHLPNKKICKTTGDVGNVEHVFTINKWNQI